MDFRKISGIPEPLPWQRCWEVGGCRKCVNFFFGVGTGGAGAGGGGEGHMVHPVISPILWQVQG